MMSAEGVGVLCGVHTLATIHMKLNKLRGVSLSGIRQERGELGRVMPWGHLVLVGKA
jgi:hypothetical protein